MPKKFYVPVGFEEVKQMYEVDMRGFPLRAPHQSPLSLVADAERASTIVKSRFVKAEPYAGYVAEVLVGDDFAREFPSPEPGSPHDGELRVPPDELTKLNSIMQGPLVVTSGLFGPEFKGYIPELFNFTGRDALGQLTMLSNLLFYSRMDFIGEVNANNLAVFLHFPFWATCDLLETDISDERRMSILSAISKTWSKEFPRLPAIDPGLQ